MNNLIKVDSLFWDMSHSISHTTYCSVSFLEYMNTHWISHSWVYKQNVQIGHFCKLIEFVMPNIPKVRYSESLLFRKPKLGQGLGFRVRIRNNKPYALFGITNSEQWKHNHIDSHWKAGISVVNMVAWWVDTQIVVADPGSYQVIFSPKILWT